MGLVQMHPGAMILEFTLYMHWTRSGVIFFRNALMTGTKSAQRKS